jgi:hypothetical protein
MNMLIRTGDSVGVPDISYTEIGPIVLDLKRRTGGAGYALCLVFSDANVSLQSCGAWLGW